MSENMKVQGIARIKGQRTTRRTAVWAQMARGVGSANPEVLIVADEGTTNTGYRPAAEIYVTPKDARTLRDELSRILAQHEASLSGGE